VASCGHGVDVRRRVIVNRGAETQKAPRGALYFSRILVVPGAHEINKLRRPIRVSFYEWTPVSAIPLPQNRPNKPRCDRIKLTLEYHSPLGSGEIKTRAELARRVGVS